MAPLDVPAPRVEPQPAKPAPQVEDKPRRDRDARHRDQKRRDDRERDEKRRDDRDRRGDRAEKGAPVVGLGDHVPDFLMRSLKITKD